MRRPLTGSLVIALAALTLMPTVQASSRPGTSGPTIDRASSAASATPRGPKGQWVGTLSGGAAMIAVISDGYEATAYVCDSNKVGAWFRGPALGGVLSLRNSTGASLTATLRNNGVAGTFTAPGGAVTAFTAASASGHVLYRAEARSGKDALLGGWILGAHGEQRGLLSVNNTPVAAPVLTTNAAPTQVGATPSVPPAAIAAVTIPPGTIAPTTAPPATLALPVPPTAPPATVTIAPTTTPASLKTAAPITVPTTPPATLPALAATAPASLNVRPNLPGFPTLTLSAQVVVPDTLTPPTSNTTGFDDFVFVVLGDSYAAGEGNPATPAHNVVKKTGDLRLLAVPGAAGAVVGGSTLMGGGLGPIGAAIGAAIGGILAVPAALAAFLSTGERPVINGTPTTVPGTGWGGTDAETPIADDARRCHRSSESGAAKTARDLAAEFAPKGVHIRFVSLACSGARATQLVNESYIGQESNAGAPLLPPQLNQIKTLNPPVDHIDALYMSAGGNDSGFAVVVNECAILPNPVPCNSSPSDLPARVQNGGDSPGLQHFAGVRSLANAYQLLDQKLQQLDPNNALMTPQNVYISHYPNSTRGTNGVTHCSGTNLDARLHNDTLGFIDEGEATFAEGVLLDFNTAITNAVTSFRPGTGGRTRGGWQLVKFAGNNDGQPVAPLAADDFATHGLCSNDPWVNTGEAALVTEGIAGLVDLADILDISSGVVHPNNAGYTAYESRMLPLLRSQLQAMVDLVPERPVRLRQVAATKNGAVTIRWDDKAINESKYVVYRRKINVQGLPPSVVAQLPQLRTRLIVGPLNLTDGFAKVADLGPDTQQFVDPLSGAGTFEYLVVACSRFDKCSSGVQANAATASGSSLAPTTVATNEEPVVPVNVASVGGPISRINGAVVPGPGAPNSNLSWSDDARNQSFQVTIREDLNGTPVLREIKGLADPSVVLGPGGPAGAAVNALPKTPADFIVRGCNIFGCSAASDPSVGIQIGTPTLAQPSVTLPPFTIATAPRTVPSLP